MSMLARYQRPGGFKQLLMLIEVCGKQKQESFLKIVEAEDPEWAKMVRQKMLTIPKILSWESDVLAEIFSRVQDLTLAVALHGFSDDNWTKISATFPHSKKRKIETLKEEQTPDSPEITAAFQKLLQDVRQYMNEGYIRIEKIDTELAIEDNIEEKLSGSLNSAIKSKEAEDTKSESAPQTNSPQQNGDVQQMYRKMQSMHQENLKLKTEIKLLKERLQNIKKMAA